MSNADAVNPEGIRFFRDASGSIPTIIAAEFVWSPQTEARLGMGRTPREAIESMDMIPSAIREHNMLSWMTSNCWLTADEAEAYRPEGINVTADDLDDEASAWGGTADSDRLAEAVAGREGWDTDVETSPDDSRIWRTDGIAGVASSGRGWVVLDVEGDPASEVLADLEEALSAADALD